MYERLIPQIKKKKKKLYVCVYVDPDIYLIQKKKKKTAHIFFTNYT